MEQIDLQLIERYFEGDLDEQELATVSQKLQADPNFAEAFRLEQDMLDGITLAGNQRMRGRLDTIHEEETKQPKAIVLPLKSRSRWIWLAAAAFIGAVILGKLYFDGQGKTPEQLYAAYAVHDFDFTEKGGGEAELAKAEQLLKEKKYAEALPVLEGYLTMHPEDGQVMLAKGVALVELGKEVKAISVFEEVSNGNPLLADEASWQMALAYLKFGNLEKAKKALGLVTAESFRYEPARALERMIERLKE